MSMLHYFQVIIISSTLLVTSSCKTVVLSEAESPIVITDEDPKILFLAFQFQKEELTLQVRKIVDGKLKPSNDSKSGAVGDVILRQVGADGEVIHEIYKTNPRKKRVEFVNDEGSLAYKDVEIDNAEFSYRVQLVSGVKVVHLYEVGSREKGELLYVLEL